MSKNLTTEASGAQHFLVMYTKSLLARILHTFAILYQKWMHMKFSKIFATIVVSGACSAFAGQVLIVNNASGTSEPLTTADVTNNLQSLHQAAGNSVTVADNLPTDLSGYSQVWDVRFNLGLDSSESARYGSYLSAGGGLFLMGENSGFMSRNNSILALIDQLGGSAIGFAPCDDGTQTVRGPFTGPNGVSLVQYAAPGCFAAVGTGEWITSRADNSIGSGIAFSVGSLANASAGALISILDVNFMMNFFDLPNSQSLTMNLIQYVGNQVEPPTQVPEPGSLALVGLGLAGILAARRRKV